MKFPFFDFFKFNEVKNTPEDEKYHEKTNILMVIDF